MDERIFCYVLVDLENVQPTAADIGRFLPGCRILVFARGSDRIAVDLAIALARSERSEFVLIEHSGKNALDFHIACKLGMLSREAPNCFAYVISKDTGYDSVITWLNKHTGLTVKRAPEFNNLPRNIYLPPALSKVVSFVQLPETAPPAQSYGTLQENAAKAIAYLNKFKNNLPGKQATLVNALNVCFQRQLPDKLLAGLINYLVTTQQCISIDDKGNVTYALPISADTDESVLSDNDENRNILCMVASDNEPDNASEQNTA